MSTSSGQRKSFQTLTTAKIDTTPRIGRDIGRITDHSARSGPAPSIDGGGEQLGRDRVEEALEQQDAEGVARHRGQPDHPRGVEQAPVQERQAVGGQVGRQREHRGRDHQRRQHREQDRRCRTPGAAWRTRTPRRRRRPAGRPARRRRRASCSTAAGRGRLRSRRWSSCPGCGCAGSSVGGIWMISCGDFRPPVTIQYSGKRKTRREEHDQDPEHGPVGDSPGRPVQLGPGDQGAGGWLRRRPWVSPPPRERASLR